MSVTYLNNVRIEINRPIGRMLLQRVDEIPRPDNVTKLESYSDGEQSTFLVMLPSGVWCGFRVRADRRGWWAIYANTEIDLMRALESMSMPPVQEYPLA